MVFLEHLVHKVSLYLFYIILFLLHFSTEQPWQTRLFKMNGSGIHSVTLNDISHLISHILTSK